MGDGPPGFGQDSSCPALLRWPECRHLRLTYGALTPCGAPSQTLRIQRCFLLTARGPAHVPTWLLQPRSRSNGVHLGTAPVWAPPRSLAATEGISIDFFSSGYLDGSVPQVYRSWHYVFTPWHTSFGRMGYPIRSPAHHRIFAPTRGFSQLVTTFFVRQLQGIRRGPFLT